MGNKRYTDADVVQALKERAQEITQKDLAKLLEVSPQYVNDLIQGRRPIEPVAKKLGYTLVHFYTKDAAARLVFPNPPKVKKGGKYSHDEFLSVMVHMIGDVPHRTVSAELGFAPSYINRLLERASPPPAPIAKAFGFTRVKTGPKTYIFVKD